MIALKPETHNDDKEALKELAQGALVMLLVVGLFVGLIATLAVIDKDNVPMAKGPFRVVDEYGDCDVVEYVPKGKAQVAFFLHCKP